MICNICMEQLECANCHSAVSDPTPENVEPTLLGPEYQAFVADCAKHCRCTHTVCGGVLAGGMCDELIEDDSEEGFYEDRDGIDDSPND